MIETELMSRRSYGCQESGGVRCRKEFWKMSPNKVFLVDSNNDIHSTTVPQLLFGSVGAELDFV